MSYIVNSMGSQFFNKSLFIGIGKKPFAPGKAIINKIAFRAILETQNMFRQIQNTYKILFVVGNWSVTFFNAN